MSEYIILCSSRPFIFPFRCVSFFSTSSYCSRLNAPFSSITVWITYRVWWISLRFHICLQRNGINSHKCFMAKRHGNLQWAAWWCVWEFHGIENLYLIINSKHNQAWGRIESKKKKHFPLSYGRQRKKNIHIVFAQKRTANSIVCTSYKHVWIRCVFQANTFF